MLVLQRRADAVARPRPFVTHQTCNDLVGGIDCGQSILEGVIVNHYAPFQQGGSGTLRDATDDLVGQILRSNTYLRAQGAARARRTGGTPGFSVSLAGTSPVTGEVEQVTVVTRGLPDGHVIYVLGIAPGRASATFGRAFSRMLQSLRVNDQAAHRGN